VSCHQPHFYLGVGFPTLHRCDGCGGPLPLDTPYLACQPRGKSDAFVMCTKCLDHAAEKLALWRAGDASQAL
jgi:hypothetical protein